VIAIVAAAVLGGPEVGLIVRALAVLEISISFDKRDRQRRGPQVHEPRNGSRCS